MLFDFPRGLLFLKAGTGRLAEDEATGNPLTFNTNVAKPLRSLLIPFTPVQSGTGDPSPENVRPITGWTGLNVYHGQNLYDYSDNENGFLDSAGRKQSSNNWEITDFIPVSGSDIVYDGITTPGASPYSAWYNESNTLISTFKQQTGKNTLSIPSGAKYVRFSLLLQDAIDDVHNFKLFCPTTYPVTWTESGTIYGGTLDLVTGVLTVEWHETVITGQQTYYTGASYIKSDACDAYFSDALTLPSGSAGYCNQLKKAVNDEGIWSRPGYPNYFRVNGKQLHFNIANDLLGITDYTQETQETAMAKIKAYLKDLYDNGTPLVFVTKLATPQTIQLTPEQITALVGNNTIWSDTNGENTVVYLKKA